MQSLWAFLQIIGFESHLLGVSFSSIGDVFDYGFLWQVFQALEDGLERRGELLDVFVGEAERRNQEHDVLVMALHGRDDLLLTHPVGKNALVINFFALKD